MNVIKDEKYMSMALDLAAEAASVGEVPVGAVIVDDNDQIVATGFNQTITSCDPTAHAEIVALRAAAVFNNNYRLNNLKIYISLEPCLMCLGALFHARIAEIIYAANDPKTGACGGAVNIPLETKLNHHAAIRSGVLEQESARLLKEFFKQRRN